MTAEHRGYAFRFFAFFGGPRVLDAVISEIGSQTEICRPADVNGWLDDAFRQIVRTRAAVAAAVLPFNERNMMRMIKVAVRARAPRRKSRRKLRAATTKSGLGRFMRK